MKVSKIFFTDDGDEYTKQVELSEFFKDAEITYTNDWGNGSAIIISFEELVEDEEELVSAVKKALQ